jgi:putative phosphoesterase
VIYNKFMKFGIISDTHGSLPSAVHGAFAGVDHILHAGDIGGEQILAELELIAPVTAVLGNNDFHGYYPELGSSFYGMIGNTRFFMAHTPLQIEEGLCGWGGIPAGMPLPHICVHGHTHIPRNEVVGATLTLNPGSPVLPRAGNGPSVMLLEAKDGYPVKVEIVLI